MLTLHINQDTDALEHAKQAITRGESFTVVIEGFGAKMVKRMKPLFAYLSGNDKRKLGKLEGLKYSIYALFIGDFGPIYHYAMRARMNAGWEEGSNSVSVSFKFCQEQERKNGDIHHVVAGVLRRRGKE